MVQMKSIYQSSNWVKINQRLNKHVKNINMLKTKANKTALTELKIIKK